MLFFALLPVAVWLANRFVSSAAWAPTKSDPHLSRAASGASDAPCMPQWVAISGDDMKKLQTESADWIRYRSAYPSRRNSGRLNFTRRPKPKKPDQRAWDVYEQRNEHQCQQWVLVPTFIPVSHLTEPLAGAPSEATLFAYYKPPLQGWHEHWTNIHRICYLAEKHPQIQTVRKHKQNKALDPTRFDSYGRAVEFHQAPFDLAIGLAASGAEMFVGVTTNNIKKEDTEQHRGGPHQREQQQSPLISEERTAEECQVLPARGIRVGQAGKRWLQASTFDEESHAAVAGAVAELAKPTT